MASGRSTTRANGRRCCSAAGRCSARTSYAGRPHPGREKRLLISCSDRTPVFGYALLNRRAATVPRCCCASSSWIFPCCSGSPGGRSRPRWGVPRPRRAGRADGTPASAESRRRPGEAHSDHPAEIQAIRQRAACHAGDGARGGKRAAGRRAVRGGSRVDRLRGGPQALDHRPESRRLRPARGVARRAAPGAGDTRERP